MGLIRKIFGLGRVVKDVAEVFVPNKTEREAHLHSQRIANYEQFTAEFRANREGWFDRFVNALNRLPRPILALGTVGLFAYAMADPIGFSMRMRGLQLVPEPLCWLLGAVVSFYFGARELHYLRTPKRKPNPGPLGRATKDENKALEAIRGRD